MQDAMIKPEWEKLTFVSLLPASDIRLALKDEKWRRFRSELVDLPIEWKFQKLWLWCEEHNWSFASKMQATNYVEILRKKGLIQ